MAGLGETRRYCRTHWIGPIALLQDSGLEPDSRDMDDQIIELMCISSQPVFALRIPDGSLMRVAQSNPPLTFDNENLSRMKPATDSEQELP